MESNSKFNSVPENLIHCLLNNGDVLHHDILIPMITKHFKAVKKEELHFINLGFPLNDRAKSNPIRRIVCRHGGKTRHKKSKKADYSFVINAIYMRDTVIDELTDYLLIRKTIYTHSDHIPCTNSSDIQEIVSLRDTTACHGSLIRQLALLGMPSSKIVRHLTAIDRSHEFKSRCIRNALPLCFQYTTMQRVL